MLRAWLAEAVPNVHPVGRNGMHRYNNQDHSMLTAMLAVENILAGTAHDLWAVNVEEEYHEAVQPDLVHRRPAQRCTPTRRRPAPAATPRSCRAAPRAEREESAA